IPALIPSQYFGDIRMRLAFYKRMSDIEHPSDLNQTDDELRDQFGKPPAEVTNPCGVRLIRWTCKTLGIQERSAGHQSVSLSFTPETPLPPDQGVQLATREPRKYNLTPDMRLNIRMEEIAWPNVYDELVKLKSLCS